MKFILALFALICSSDAIHAQTVTDSENAKSIPVKHWEFDYFNYGVSGGQETVYLNFSMALRYNTAGIVVQEPQAQSRRYMT